MAATMIAFHFTIGFCLKRRMNSVLAYALGCIAAVIFNVPIALLAASPILSFAVAMAYVPALIPAAILNVAIATIVYSFFPKKYRSLSPVEHAA